ncbi:uncharacterized protein EI97DRAFT_324929 [Westerdykella ornata]|uniref:Uncharacterized protein n=1 Tax=Westerdykella ornata TaxID=318751 RepID=A0A6A6JML9_WESOR|nr:uncharacterized protein EI97DRAFT_324929 [Westerdykella ornata]KAF2276906.1 hypothetical protein EI97DRAFT_324929 [Westerdykella ornata]
MPFSSDKGNDVHSHKSAEEEVPPYTEQPLRDRRQRVLRRARGTARRIMRAFHPLWRVALPVVGFILSLLCWCLCFPVPLVW